VRLPPRELKSSTKRRRYRLRGFDPKKMSVRKNDMGKSHMVGRNLVNAAKFTRKRIPLLQNKPHWIVRLGHADVDSAVWERRHRKQDKSASVPKKGCCGQRTRWKKNPTSVSV